MTVSGELGGGARRPRPDRQRRRGPQHGGDVRAQRGRSHQPAGVARSSPITRASRRMLMQVGTSEVLYDDTIRVAEAARQAGVDVEVQEADGMVHVYQMHVVRPPPGRRRHRQDRRATSGSRPAHVPRRRRTAPTGGQQEREAAHHVHPDPAAGLSGSDHRLRRHRDRGRLRRTAHAVRAAPARAVRHGARGGVRRGRHVVLEPLPRGPHRLRVVGVLLLVLQGAGAGVELGRALPVAARGAQVPRARHRSLRPAQGHPVQHPGEVGRLRRAPPTRGPSPPSRARRSPAPTSSPPPGRSRCRSTRPFEGLDSFDGRLVPHRPLAQGGGRLHRQARRRSSAPAPPPSR